MTDTLTGKGKRRYDGVKFIHNTEPDYKNALLEIPHDFHEKVLTKLTFLYDKQMANKYMPELERICKVYSAYKTEEMAEIEKTFD